MIWFIIACYGSVANDKANDSIHAQQAQQISDLAEQTAEIKEQVSDIKGKLEKLFPEEFAEIQEENEAAAEAEAAAAEEPKVEEEKTD